MEPASSSDDDSSSASSHSSYYASDIDEPELTNNVASLDDLPSEDSCGEELDDESDQDFDHNDHVGNDLGNVSETKGGTIKDLVDERRYGGHLRDKQQIQKNRKKALKVALSKISTLKKQNKSIRSEKRDKSIFDGDGESHDDDNKLKRNNSELGNKKKKRSKHAPTEVSSKRKDYFNRGAPVLQNSGVSMKTPGLYKPRDPRMQSLSGYLDETLFDHRYGFLEDIQDKEISDLREKIKAQKMTGKKGRKMRKRHGIVSYDQSTIQVNATTNDLLLNFNTQNVVIAFLCFHLGR